MVMLFIVDHIVEDRRFKIEDVGGDDDVDDYQACEDWLAVAATINLQPQGGGHPPNPKIETILQNGRKSNWATQRKNPRMGSRCQRRDGGRYLAPSFKAGGVWLRPEDPHERVKRGA